jgi:two-component system, OmpR family, sensor histidine kinase ArlS
MQILRTTIRQRLTIFISISALVILLLEGYFIYRFYVNFCEQEFKSRIQERLILADSVIALDRSHPYEALTRLPPGNLPDEQFFYAANPEQILQLKNDGIVIQSLDTALFNTCKFCFLHLGQREYGFHTDSISHHTLVLSAVDQYGESKIHTLRNGVIMGVIFGILILMLISWFWIQRMLQPIADKIQKARTIGAKSLDLRLIVKNNYDELGQLAITFNEMLDRIEQGFRVQQEFIRNASHEMRTPLTAITAEVDLAQKQNSSQESAQKALENIKTRAENLNEMVTQLLLMAKIETDNITKSPSFCAADEVLLQTIKMLQSKYPNAKQQIRLEIDSSDAAQFMVGCDAIMLQAAYFNLLDNAVKYGKEAPIFIHLHLLNKKVVLSVKDQGIGIPKHEMEHLFKPFYRINRHQTTGSGIGLTLTKSIAEKYGGNVQLTSELKEGTTATFSLPQF